MIPAVKAAFDQARTVALLTHVSADGDAFGSTLALMHVLRARGKQVVFYCNDTPADMYAFLPGIHEIVPLPDQLAEFDLVVALDAADLNRLSACAAVLKQGTTYASTITVQSGYDSILINPMLRTARCYDFTD
jgi:nanoRNase/pAp phosphatase (c-di-AMP/oligoRNAs hydrolase)